MDTRSRVAFAGLSASVIFLGAFLLFQVQPVTSKMILPWFGGGPAVWTACMLFFQVLLLAGYAYAHLLAQLPQWRLATVVHMTLVVGAIACLPIMPSEGWKPEDASHPTWRILILLAANIGLPYFVLSTTSPLVQVWFARRLPDRSPYRLYALSNVGSLGALLTYPFLVEPRWTTGQQDWMWSLGFLVFALLLAAVTWWGNRSGLAGLAKTASPAPYTEPIPPVMRRLLWLLLPALASVMLLAVTSHVCLDVAVIPFLWVVPLSLYLLSFIICFERPAWYRRRIYSALALLAIVFLAFYELEDLVAEWTESWGWGSEPFAWMDSLAAEATAYLVMLLLVCLVCHGEVARWKPPPNRLTDFYLMVATGGALGGILVGLVCPLVFDLYLELNIALVLSFMVAISVLWDDCWMTWLLNRPWKRCVWFGLGFAILCIVVRAQMEVYDPKTIAMERNFYGVLAVKEYNKDDPDSHILELVNGRILHGSQFQSLARRREPTTYYSYESGIGLTLSHYPIAEPPMHVAVVGLGTGTIAAYGGYGDHYCFYEINPAVEKLSRTYFTYIKDSRADVTVRLGDARLSLERLPPQHYDVIALDAFSSDAIPVHLLTREAFESYFRHLKPDGVIAVHISNRHLDLKPVVGEMARLFEVPAVLVESDDYGGAGDASADWVLMTRNREFLALDAIRSAAAPIAGTYRPVRLWTDDYSNLFEILD